MQIDIINIFVHGYYEKLNQLIEIKQNDYVYCKRLFP